jgi:membrane associated rhomboid family serine protease
VSQPFSYDQLSPVPPLTPVTKKLIIICVIAYFIDFLLSHLGFQIGGLYLNEILGIVPLYVKNKWWLWQFLTYIFMHGHPLHLLLNMLILWYFGSEIEIRLGRAEFLRYFLLCGVGAGVFNYAVNVAFSDVSRLSHPIIGASGAIFGILAAYGIFFGNRYFLVFFLFPMKAKYFVLLMAGIELIMGVEANAQDNVAHFAHLGGMVVGALYTYFFHVRPPRGGRGSAKDRERERLKRQFTLIVNQDSSTSSSSDGERGPYWN